MQNMALSIKDSSKDIHKINIWLTEENYKIIKIIFMHFKVNDKTKSRSQIISDILEYAYFSNPDKNFEKSLRTRSDMLYKTTIYLTSQVIQMIFNIETHFFELKRLTPSKIVNAAISTYMPSLKEVE